MQSRYTRNILVIRARNRKRYKTINNKYNLLVVHSGTFFQNNGNKSLFSKRPHRFG